MKYYLKQSGFLFFYNIFMTIIAFAIMCIQGDDLLWLRLSLSFLNIALYLSIVGMSLYKEGQEALKVRYANDLEREQIIKTGDALPLKIHEEYKPWKGYLIGGLICSPMVLALIVHAILALASGGTINGAGAVAGIVYMAFFAPISALSAQAVILWWQYFILLYCVPLISAVSGICYNLGAAKIQRQYDKIREQHRQIYGDEN